jgi:hypothetical protein
LFFHLYTRIKSALCTNIQCSVFAYIVTFSSEFYTFIYFCVVSIFSTWNFSYNMRLAVMTSSVFVYWRMSLFLLHFWSTVLLNTLFLFGIFIAALWLCHSIPFWSAMFLLQNPVIACGLPWYMTSHFPCCFQNFIFVFAFDNLSVMSLTMDLFGYILFGVCLTSWVLLSSSFSRFGMFSAISS